MPGKSMQELSEWDELKTFFDRRLIKALGHPVREHILAVLNERIASAREIGDEIGADVSSFYHHVEELEKLGCIERVETKRRRGASEHFFRAKRTVFFDDAAWQALPGSLKSDSIVSTLQYVVDDVVSSIEAETFASRDETHVSWTPGRFDSQGWKEATNLLRDALTGIVAIQEAAAQRLAKSEEAGIAASVGILAYETPRPQNDADASERARQHARKPHRASSL
ncbi:MAG TPA: winged helix-turn-helix domain-containing protein [Solirubrobacterales bacterium]|nr:winged helix-turn-helix domain-containing protein [Solirubrobacterales bacterium]